jgi:hypothetical protein
MPPEEPQRWELEVWARRFDGESGHEFEPFLRGTATFESCAREALESRDDPDAAAEREACDAKAEAFDTLLAAVEDGDDPYPVLIELLTELGHYDQK